jgi:hypothetical protein
LSPVKTAERWLELCGLARNFSGQLYSLSKTVGCFVHLSPKNFQGSSFLKKNVSLPQFPNRTSGAGCKPAPATVIQIFSKSNIDSFFHFDDISVH